MLSAIILIAIVSFTFTFAIYPIYQRYTSAAAGAGRAVGDSGEAAQVGISLTYATAVQASGSTLITLYVYSYGSSPFTPSGFIVEVPGAGTYHVPASRASITVGGNQASTIPPRSAATISFTIPYSGAMPSTYRITAVGGGISITWTA